MSTWKLGLASLYCRQYLSSLPTEFEVGGAGVALDLQDTGGSYTQDFPAMVQLSLQSADAVILGNIANSRLMMV